MRLIRRRACARAGLVGNPSDGYGGKTIAVVVRNFFAEVSLYDWPRIEIVWSQEDNSRFDSIYELTQDVKLHGYYGGVRLVKATIKRFVEHCTAKGILLHDGTFSVRYESNIPRQVGLAGSSAIIIATLRALMDFYGVTEEEIPLRVQPSLALSVETQELGISAGLQDRVAQVYEGAVYMDFDEDRMEEIDGLKCGQYERLDPTSLPELYLSYCTEVGEPTYVVHNPLPARFEAGEPAVHEAMRKFASLTDAAREAISAGDADRLSHILNENFDTRESICPILVEQKDMVSAARSTGASAKFAGSGGAIIGTCPDEATFARLQAALGEMGCRVIRPRVVV